MLTGQSNSLGAVKGSPASPELLKKYEPKETLYWHENFGQREGVFPGASTSWEQVRPAMPRYNGNLCMGPEYGFAFTLEKNGWFKDADVAVVKASRDGGDNSHWRKNGQAYRTLVQAVKNACAGVDRSKYSKVEFAGLLYLQGESNAGTSVPESASRFLELLGNLAADLNRTGIRPHWLRRKPSLEKMPIGPERMNLIRKRVTLPAAWKDAIRKFRERQPAR